MRRKPQLIGFVLSAPQLNHSRRPQTKQSDDGIGQPEPCGSSCDTLPASYSPRRAQQRNNTLVAGANTKVSPIPLSNCFASLLPA